MTTLPRLAHHKAKNQSHWRRVSVTGFMGALHPEDRVAVCRIAEHHGQQEHRTCQQQGLGLGCCSRLPKGNLKGHQPRPHSDAQTEKEGTEFVVAMQVTPQKNKQDK